MLKATVSGSFHRHLDAISVAVQELNALSVRVLSPADPRVVDAHGEFLFVASDRVRSVHLVQGTVTWTQFVRRTSSDSCAPMGIVDDKRPWK